MRIHTYGNSVLAEEGKSPPNSLEAAAKHQVPPSTHGSGWHDASELGINVCILGVEIHAEKACGEDANRW